MSGIILVGGKISTKDDIGNKGGWGWVGLENTPKETCSFARWRDILAQTHEALELFHDLSR